MRLQPAQRQGRAATLWVSHHLFFRLSCHLLFVARAILLGTLRTLCPQTRLRLNIWYFFFCSVAATTSTALLSHL